jgi:hypothetical protein
MYLFDKLPILLSPVINEIDEGFAAVLELKIEMEYRYSLLRANRNALDKLPFIVCVIDEFHFLITDIDDKEERKDLDNALSGLIKRGRNAKIHMVFATQEPKKEHIKFGSVSNSQSRIGLMLPDIHESIAAIGKPGAEKLVGKGAMIVKLPNDGLMYKNIQGAYMPESGIKNLLKEIEFNIPNKYQLHGQRVGIPHSQQEAGFTEITVTPAAIVDVYDEVLAKSILLAISQDTFATSKIKDFGVGHGNVIKVAKRLEQLDLITEKDERKSLKPRLVKSKSLDELLGMPELMEILERNGFSKTDVAEAVGKRKGK